MSCSKVFDEMKLATETLGYGFGDVLLVLAVVCKGLAKMIIQLTVMHFFRFVPVHSHAVFIFRMMMQEIERHKGDAEEQQQNRCEIWTKRFQKKELRR